MTSGTRAITTGGRNAERFTGFAGFAAALRSTNTPPVCGTLQPSAFLSAVRERFART